MGRGEMYGNKYLPINNAPPGVNEEMPDYYKNIIEAKEETIQTQKKYIIRLEKELGRSGIVEPAEEAGQKRKVG
jgi:hypothetical protein